MDYKIYFFLTGINSTFTRIENIMGLRKASCRRTRLEEVMFYGGCGKLVSE
jgi:hypothetical protein